MKTYPTNFRVAIEWCNNSYVMCNNLPEIDPSIWDNIQSVPSFSGEGDEDDEQEMPEVYQFFISDCSKDDMEYLRDNFGLLFTYSDLLDCYILLVTHFGTSWDYVYWDTTNEHAQRDLGQRK